MFTTSMFYNFSKLVYVKQSTRSLIVGLTEGVVYIVVVPHLSCLFTYIFVDKCWIY